jgi:sulfur carrier protein
MKENSMNIIVNGDPVEVESNLTLLTLLARLDKSANQVAVEHNGEVIEPDDFATLMLQASDRLELVHFVGGG